jgi:phosphoserine phosphatase
MINPVAEALQIPLHRVYANNLIFKDDGSFQGFDETEPTSRDGGKPSVIQSLKDAHGYDIVVMVGDGATDMQARPPADAFIGFGGIVVRESVKAGSDWFVTDFQVIWVMCYFRDL